MALGGQAAFPTAGWDAEIVTAEEVERASFGFHRAYPARSAKRVLHFTQAFVGLALVAAIAWAFVSWPATAWSALHASAWVLFAIVIAWRLLAASNLQPILWRLAAPTQFPVYTILCPLRGEANVVADLIAALERLDYPAMAYQCNCRFPAALKRLGAPNLGACNARDYRSAWRVGVSRTQRSVARTA